MAHFKRDSGLALILLFLKYTVIPDMNWWLVFTPIIIGFSYNFIKGFIAGAEKRKKDLTDE